MATTKTPRPRMTLAMRTALMDMACQNMPIYNRCTGEALVRRGWATKMEDRGPNGQILWASYRITVEGVAALVEWATKRWSAGRLVKLIDRVKPAVKAAKEIRDRQEEIVAQAWGTVVDCTILAGGDFAAVARAIQWTEEDLKASHLWTARNRQAVESQRFWLAWIAEKAAPPAA